MDKQSKRIAEQAAAYFVQGRNDTAAQRREREAWLAADERHAHAFEEAQRLWARIGDLRDDIHWQARKAADLASLRSSHRLSARPILMAAAVVALLLSGAYLLVRFIASQPIARYATAVGERRTEILADGTHVVLNTNSVLEARYTHGRRDVELQRGEVQFEVTHDAARPFVVSVAKDTVTALGTRFQVRRDAGSAEAVVTLLKGSVEVANGRAQRILRPNEQARLLPHAGIRVQTVDPGQVNGWLDGWLRFRNAPLSQVAAEANRYSSRKLRLGDSSLAGLALSGNFRAGDNVSIAAGVEQILPVRADDHGTEIVLRSK